MFKGAEEGTFTICAHSSLSRTAWELCKINVTTYPCKLPKPNPEATSIYSTSTMRCFMLKRNIKHVFMASSLAREEKRKYPRKPDMIYTHWDTATGDRSSQKPHLALSFFRPQEYGHRAQRREPTVIKPFIQPILTF